MGQTDERRNEPDSPIGQLLKHLGMTREDLQRHSSQMREFLTTESTTASPPEDSIESAKLGVEGQPPRQPRSRASSHGNAPGIPQTPVKSRHNNGLHKQDTMEAIIERQNKLARKEKRGRRDSNAMGPPSPTPRPVALPSGSSTSTPRESKRESLSQEPETQPLVYAQGSYQSSRLKFKSSYRSTSPLPPSSPPSTPPRCSSPIVNVVSSPGPPSNDDDEAPYVIPPGPYPAEKPDLSYAALIGQAILSSKEHRLSLQHIYEWISKVYPYYKRTDQIWMNSIRHVLSTSIVFRKVQRGQNKSLWAILDKDLPCFEGGGFDRRLCEDMNNAKSKARPRKRRAETTNEPSIKRFKLERPPAAPVPFYHPPAVSMLANPHLQPYYSAYGYPYTYANPAYIAAMHAPVSYQPQVQAAASSSQSPPQPVPDLSSSGGFSSSPVTSLKEPRSSQNTDPDDAVEIVNEQAIPGSDGIEPLATLLRSDVLDSDPPQKPPDVKENDPPGGPSPKSSKSSQPPVLPSTPPRKTSGKRPVSPASPSTSRGLRASPSTFLNPPTSSSTVTIPLASDVPKTPSRPSRSNLLPPQYFPPPPVTPNKKPGFPILTGDSPFNSPSKAVFDPHDPRAVLDEELRRYGDRDLYSSPVGLFGKNKGVLLYQSPGVPSPGATGWW